MRQSTKTESSSDDLASERWYLRIDGQRFGPVGRTELEHFLRPPRLCRVMEVKCGADGDWHYITRDETIDKVLVKFGVEPDPVDEPIAQKSRDVSKPGVVAGARDFFEGLAAWLIYHRLGVAVVIAIVAVNGAALLALRDPYGREREIFTQFETLWRGVREISADDPNESWREFSVPALAKLDPLIRELEATASVHQPGRQNLLFAGRDNLRKILQDEHPPNARSPQVTLFERRLETARAQFSARTASATTPPLKGTR